MTGSNSTSKSCNHTLLSLRRMLSWNKWPRSTENARCKSLKARNRTLQGRSYSHPTTGVELSSHESRTHPVQTDKHATAASLVTSDRCITSHRTGPNDRNASQSASRTQLIWVMVQHQKSRVIHQWTQLYSISVRMWHEGKRIRVIIILGRGLIIGCRTTSWHQTSSALNKPVPHSSDTASASMVACQLPWTWLSNATKPVQRCLSDFQPNIRVTTSTAQWSMACKLLSHDLTHEASTIDDQSWASTWVMDLQHHRSLSTDKIVDPKVTNRISH